MFYDFVNFFLYKFKDENPLFSKLYRLNIFFSLFQGTAFEETVIATGLGTFYLLPAYQFLYIS
jgi:hypothetical protein